MFKEDRENVDQESKIKVAIDRYMALQYDPRRERIKLWETKLDLLNEGLMGTDSAQTIKANLPARS